MTYVRPAVQVHIFRSNYQRVVEIEIEIVDKKLLEMKNNLSKVACCSDSELSYINIKIRCFFS